MNLLRRSILYGTVLSVSMLLMQACTHAPLVSDTRALPPSALPAQEAGKAVLAGEWEYEEGGMVVPLRLDHFGNGTYDFKEGRFLTDVLTGHRWTGAWAQRANDREGAFEISLSSDYSEGDGRWWYTRIEGDTSPQKPGGRFHVVKVKSVLNKDAGESSPQF